MQTRCHLSVLVHKQAAKYGKRTALTYCRFGSREWKNMSWTDFSLNVKRASNALIESGIRPGDRIGVFSQNCAEYLFTDFGVYGVRAISIPVYATSSETQVQYIVNDASIRMIFCGEQEQYDKARRISSACPSLERIVVFDDSVAFHPEDSTSVYFRRFIGDVKELPHEAEVERLWGEASDDDICNILYTSGTTGESKGVVLTYGQYASALVANDKATEICEDDNVISFLPFTHIFERGWSYLVMTAGGRLIVNTDPHLIQDSMRETRPNCMSSVPRFWEKVYQAVMDKVDHATPMMKKLMLKAIAVGREYNINYRRLCKRAPLWLALKYRFYDSLVLSKIRAQIGLDRPHFFPTAGATVSPEVEEFVHSIGIFMIVGYGLTESLATVSCDRMDKPYSIGSVGRPLEEVDVKISPDGEILLKGPTITRGYYNRPDINEASFDAEGYFHTGDAGYLKDGELFLTERIKDLFKTSNGKYVAPQMVESLLLVDKFIDQIVVVADRRKFVSALIVPVYSLLEEYARDNKIAYKSKADLCANDDIRRMLAERINTLQQGLTHYEQVKRFVLLPRAFSMEQGEITNTLKIKRGVVYEHFAAEIDSMYAG